MTYRFGTFEFDATSGELRRSGRLVAIEPQPSRALALLLSRAGETVSRDELRQAVWDNETHVDFDRGLAYVVSQIRAALGDTADNPRFVQTLPRKGYRFLAPVHAISSGERVEAAPTALQAGTLPAMQPAAHAPAPGEGAVRWLAAGLALVTVLAAGWIVWSRHLRATERVTIAVSVFDNETGAGTYDRVVHGLTDAVVVRLTELDNTRLAIVGNAAVLRQPRNIRNLTAVRDQLAADYVLLGQLQRGDDGLRFITHFIRLRDQAHLKANRLTYPDGDLSTLERDVVEEFVQAVRRHILDGAGN